MGMYFPLAADSNLRHPTQLYEALFEGLVLFAVLFSMRRKIQISGIMFGLYLKGYGLVRFCIEFFREPDAHLGLVWHQFTMGQLLCIVMIISGAWLITNQHINLSKEATDESWQEHQSHIH
jgi:phosphatidylglycerol:prolipoprotein diacylglycerol transferase